MTYCLEAKTTICFDCGDGIDIVIDSNVSEGDDNAGNCEELLKKIVIPSR